jgi:FG-GAP-like repeat/Major Vault Protein repeat domain
MRWCSRERFVGLSLSCLTWVVSIGGIAAVQDRVDCDGNTLDDSAFGEPIVRDHRDEKRGALHNPTGRPLGGGEGYGAWVRQPVSVVRTRSELAAALASARRGDVVYVDDDAVIDLSRLSRPPDSDPCAGFGLSIPAGVTLASGRGRDGSLGALLRTSSFAPRSCALLVARGGGVRITGLRIRGPDTGIEQGRPELCFQEPSGILAEVSGDQPPARWDIEIDNNKLLGWPYGAVRVERVMGVRVHHNLIHYNRRQEHDGTCDREYGVGYGVVLGPGSVVVEGNVFDHNRHDIAGSGQAGERYLATYNLILAGAVQHSFDVHGGADRKDCTNVAGSSFVVHHNTFLQAHKPAFRIRGIPLQGAWVYRNETRHGNGAAAFSQVNASGLFFVEENDIGRNRFPAWFISFGAESFWAWRRFDGTGMGQIAVGDFDDTRGADAFRATGSEWLVSSGARGEWAHLNTSSIGLSSLAFGDFVGDRKTDVFRATGSEWLVSESGRGPWTHLNTSSVRLSALAFADIDGDGRTDILRADDGRWYVSRGGSTAWAELNRSDLAMSELRFGDFNGDGKDDVLSRQSPSP